MMSYHIRKLSFLWRKLNAEHDGDIDVNVPKCSVGRPHLDLDSFSLAEVNLSWCRAVLGTPGLRLLHRHGVATRKYCYRRRFRLFLFERHLV